MMYVFFLFGGAVATSTCRPLAAAKEIVSSTRLVSVEGERWGAAAFVVMVSSAS